MKKHISKYKVVDAGATVGTTAAQFDNAKLVGNFSAATVARFESGILAKDIVNIRKVAAVAADVAHQRDVTFATSPAAGDNFTVTISYLRDSQTFNKSFKYIAQTGDTVTSIATAMKDLINLSDIPFGATNASGVLTITADVAGAGYDPRISAGTDSSATTVTVEAIGSATLDAQATIASFFADEYSGVSAADFGSASNDYIAYIIEYTEDVDSVHGIVKERRFAAFFVEAAITLTNLDAALNATAHNAGRLDILA